MNSYRMIPVLKEKNYKRLYFNGLCFILHDNSSSVIVQIHKSTLQEIR